MSAADNVIAGSLISGASKEWLDVVTRGICWRNYIKPPRTRRMSLTKSTGLTALAPSDLEDERARALLLHGFPVADVVNFRLKAKQGYKVVDLSAEAPSQPIAPAQSYRTIDWSAIDNPDPSLAHEHVELRVALGFEQNAFLLADADPARYMGIRAYRPFSDDGSIYVLAERYSRTNRAFEQAVKYTNGREAENSIVSAWSVPHGHRSSHIAPEGNDCGRIDNRAPFLAPDLPAKPNGRDWFVKAGTSGGDGSREKPFRDPFQALDKAEGGDAIHVSTGDYFGKLRSGKWKIADPQSYSPRWIQPRFHGTRSMEKSDALCA